MPFHDSAARRSSRERIRLALSKARVPRISRKRGPNSPPNADPLPCPVNPRPGGLSGGAAALFESD